MFLEDEVPENLPFPDGKEVSPEIAIESVTGRTHFTLANDVILQQYTRMSDDCSKRSTNFPALVRDYSEDDWSDL